MSVRRMMAFSVFLVSCGKLLSQAFTDVISYRHDAGFLPACRLGIFCLLSDRGLDTKKALRTMFISAFFNEKLRLRFSDNYNFNVYVYICV